MNYQSLVDFQYWTFIAQLCNLFLQLYLFKRFLFKPIKNIIAKRQAEVNKVYADADEMLTTAKDAKAKYEASLDNAHQEAEAITARAVSSARLQSETLLREAQEEASALREKASREIALARRKAMNEVKGEMSQLAVEIASKVTEKEIDPADHAAMIDRFLDELGDEA